MIVHPVFLAEGLALFKQPMDLKLLGTGSVPAGAVALTYGASETSPTTTGCSPRCTWLSSSG